MIKALVTLTVTLGLAASSGLGIAPAFAERAAEFEATKAGITVAHNAHQAAPENEHFEHTYLALTEHCTNLVALYNVGAEYAGDELAAAGLPAAFDIAECS